MPKLYEKLNLNQVAALVPEVAEGLALIAEGKDPDAESTTIPKGFSDEVGLPLVQAVYFRMWHEGQRVDLPGPFERQWKGSIASIVRDWFADTVDEPIVAAVSAQLTRVLRNNHLAVNKGSHTAPLYWLAPWKTPQWLPTARPLDKKLDRMVVQQESRNPPQPVRSTVDLSLIPKPTEATPEAILAYVEKLVAAHNKLREQYTRVVDELEAFKQATKVQWGSDVLARLEGIVNGKEEP